MKINNLTMDGRGLKKYFWYWLFEILSIIARMRGQDIELTGNITINGFTITSNDLGFRLARFIKEQIDNKKIT